MMNYAIILAGGFGTRLKEVVSDVAKPMAFVNNKPFLEYLLRYLMASQVNKVILSVGYKSDSIINFFGDSYHGLEILYSIEDEPLGTGGAIAKAVNLVESKSVLILNGDSFFDIDLQIFQKRCLDEGCDVGIALKRVQDKNRYGQVNVNEMNRITGFKEKSEKAGEGYINAGIYFLNVKKFLQNGLSGKYSIERDYFSKFFTQYDFFGYVTDGFFIDIGVPDDFEKAQDEFKRFPY